MALPTERPSKSRGAATSGATAKVQENDAERRHAYARRREHRCLVYKTPRAERLSALPLAFALGRCARMAMRAQQTDNRREIDSVGVRALPKHTRGSVYVAGKQPARNKLYIERLQYILEYICTVEGFSTK